MKFIEDERGSRHYLLEELGVDGQGTIYRTRDSSILLRDSGNREADRLLFDDIKLMPLSGLEDILLPTCYLKQPNTGYIFNVPDNFVPLKSIMNLNYALDKEFYAKTGGLKKRLYILIRLAATLIELNSLPVMYGSMSADRVFISRKPDNNSMCLLYSVGMSYITDFKNEYNSDPYIAPEIQKGKGGNILSDVYAFAGLAYDLLTLCGNEHVLSEGLQALFDRVFKQPDVLLRPSMADFHKSLIALSDTFLTCKKCKKDFVFKDNINVCPHCKNPLPRLFEINIYDKISNTKINKGTKIMEVSNEHQSLYNYHTGNILLSQKIEPAIDCILNISKDKKLHMIFKNLLKHDISINDNIIGPGKAHAVLLPCEKISILIKLHSITERLIEMTFLSK